MAFMTTFSNLENNYLKYYIIKFKVHTYLLVAPDQTLMKTPETELMLHNQSTVTISAFEISVHQHQQIGKECYEYAQ